MATDPKNEDDDHFSTAADEPTAMWTGDMLREAEDAPPATAPAEAAVPAAISAKNASGTTSHPPLRSGTRRRPPLAAAPGPASMSWSLTIALAIALGTAVFYLVRFLRG